MAFIDIRFETKKAAWLDNPLLRTNAGLERALFNFRIGLSRGYYPPLPVGSHRTYITADKADGNIVEFGQRAEFGSTFYLPYLLSGTRHMMGWLGKWDELQNLLERGFRSGFEEYSE